MNKYLKNKTYFFMFFSVLLFFSSQAAFAQGIVPCGNGRDVANACTLCHLIVGINNLVSFGLGLLITVAAVAIFISGVMYIMASGSEQAMGAAKSFLAAAIKGFAITLGAWFIVGITMWIISAKEDLGIQKIRWDLTGGRVIYECSTVSSAGQGGIAGSGGQDQGPANNEPTSQPVASTSFVCKCANGLFKTEVGSSIRTDDVGTCRQICTSSGAEYYSFSHPDSTGTQWINITSTTPTSTSNICRCANGLIFKTDVGSPLNTNSIGECQQTCISRGTEYYSFSPPNSTGTQWIRTN